jgi:DNA-binding MarR family transcriptional regulator
VPDLSSVEPGSTPAARLWRLASWLLNQTASQANRLVGEALAQPGGRRRYAVLAGLEEFGPISQAELSRRLGIDRSDLVAELNQLETHGWVLRSPDPSDPRRNALRITTTGAAELQNLDERITGAQQLLLDPLSPVEQELLASLLQRLLRHHASYRP